MINSVNFIKSMFRVPFFRFSIREVKELPLQFKDQAFYLKNLEQVFSETELKSFQTEWNGKLLTIYGFNQYIYEEMYYRSYKDQLEDAMMEQDKATHTMIQIDPTYHIHLRNSLLQQAKQSKYYEGIIKDDKKKLQVPIIPQNINEVYFFMDMINLAKANNEEAKTILQNFISEDITTSTKQNGYFLRQLNGKTKEDLKNPQVLQVIEELKSEVLKQVFNSTTPGENCAQFSILLTQIMNGKIVVLGDIPSFYYRILLGLNNNILKLQEHLKVLLGEMKKAKSQKQYFKQYSEILFYQYYQTPIDYYLYFLIQNLIYDEEVKSLSVYVNAIHLEPLKIILKFYGQKGYQKDKMFWQFLKLEDVQKETNEMLIEKQALLDVLQDNQIWKQSFVSNPFCYLKDHSKILTEENRKNFEKIYYVKYKKYLNIKEEMLKELQ